MTDPARSSDSSSTRRLLLACESALRGGRPLPAGAMASGDDRIASGIEALRWLHQSQPSCPHEEMPLPERLGRFQILRRLGEGSHGRVLLANDPLLSRQVALKIPHGAIRWSADLSRRFAQEAQLAANLHHPNLVPVYDAGVCEGVPYVAYAYCDGRDMAQWLQSREARVDPQEAARLVAAIGDGVDHAHRQGVIHRDLKPSNILLAPIANPAAGEPTYRPLVTDFGLAKLLDEQAFATQSGVAVGSLAYMAPEQLDGGSGDRPQPTADVYSLGCILFELLAGAPPFGNGPAAEVLKRRACQGQPSLRRQRPGVPRDLEAVCLRALECDPHRRYATAGELSDDLRAFLAGRPTQARPVGGLRRALRLARRKPLAATLLTLLTLSLVSGMLTGWWMHRRVAHANARLRAALDQGRQAIDELSTAVVDDEIFASGSPTQQRQMVLRKSLKYYRSLSSVDPQHPELRQAAMFSLFRIGQLEQSLGQLSASQASLRSAYELIRTELPQNPTDWALRELAADVEHAIGTTVQQMARPAEAIVWLRRAYSRRRQIHDLDDQLSNQQSVVESLLALGAAHRGTEDLQTAEQYYCMALAVLDRVDASTASYKTSRAIVHVRLGKVHFKRREFDRSAQQAAIALQLLLPLVKEQPFHAGIWREAGIALELLGLAQQQRAADAEAALDHLAKSAVIRRALVTQFPGVVRYRHDLAVSYERLAAMLIERDRPEAAVLLSAAEEMIRQIRHDAPDFDVWSVALNTLADRLKSESLSPQEFLVQALVWLQLAEQAALSPSRCLRLVDLSPTLLALCPQSIDVQQQADLTGVADRIHRVAEQLLDRIEASARADRSALLRQTAVVRERLRCHSEPMVGIREPLRISVQKKAGLVPPTGRTASGHRAVLAADHFALDVTRSADGPWPAIRQLVTSQRPKR